MQQWHLLNIEKKVEEHAHNDYPDRNDAEWMVHTPAYSKFHKNAPDNEDIMLTTRPVISETLTNRFKQYLLKNAFIK